MNLTKLQRRLSNESVKCNSNASTSQLQNDFVDLMGNISDETALLAHHYQICDVIEKGPIYTIYRAKSRLSQQNNTVKYFTIKSFDLQRYLAASGLKQEDIEKEVEISAMLKHPFLCELKDVIYGSNVLHMVFEYVEGSDICFEIVKRVSSGFIYSEAVASHYFRQLMEALQYIHSQNIIHRDIRPHNILLSNKENNASLKLRGFGVAYQLDSLKDSCPPGRLGIPQFMAPEIAAANSNYGTAADIWSAGVVLYILLFGRLPFVGTPNEIYEFIQSGSYLKNDSDLWKKIISESAKDLLSKLLCVDDKKRLTANEVLKHPWLYNRSACPKIHLNETVDNIRKYNIRRKLKSNIVATANNKRWNFFPINSYLTSDSVPGGDACDFDCTRRRLEICGLGDDMFNVQMILSSLDQAAILSDYSIDTQSLDLSKNEKNINSQLNVALNDQNLNELLLLYDRIRSHGIRPSPLNRNAEQCLSESKNEANSWIEANNSNAELTELLSLLNNAHLHAILQAQDVVIEEVFASTIFTLPSNCQLNQQFENLTINDSTNKLNGIEINANLLDVPNTFCNNFTGNNTKLNLIGNESLKTLPLNSTDLITLTNNELIDNNITSESVPSTSYVNSSILKNKLIKKNQFDAMNEEGPTTLFYDNDNDDLLMNAVSRVRLVQFQKDTEEPMGITLKVLEDNRCLIARIMHGGLIHRQSTLHVGDEIREINGVSVTNQSVDALQQMLRDARGHVQFKIVPSYRSAPPACEIFVRAQFDYDPSQDDLIPCPPAGVSFRTGDILQVISKDDHNWWQARYVSPFPAIGNISTSNNILQYNHLFYQNNATTSNIEQNIGAATSKIIPPLPLPNSRGITPTSPVGAYIVAGLIPSPELQEWRTACLAMDRAQDNSTCMWFNKKKKYYTTKYLKKHSELFEQLDLVTYEEVIRLSSFRRKTLVLLGAHGVGRRHIKNTLIQKHSQRFAYPQPHTTRPMRKDEIDGKHYFFVSNDVMLADIQANEYLEYGTHEESMYGTKLETIRSIHRSGKMAILDVEPQALKVLRSAEYAPFVVFIAAPDLHGLQDPDGSLERLVKESEVLKQAFGHLFDYIICNNDIDETIHQLEIIVEKLSVIPQWIPVSWVY